MPSKYRPYYPRRYGNAQAGDPDAFSRGMKIGQGFVGQLGGLAKAIQGAQQQSRMNDVANRLMGQQAAQNLPGDQSLGQLPADTGGGPQDFTLPDTGGYGPNVGDLAPTGGLAELQLRQSFAKSQLADQVQKQRLATLLAQQGAASAATRRAGGGDGSGSRWQQFLQQQGGQYGGGSWGKPKKYVPGSGDVQNDPATDDFNQIGADFDAQQGKKGAFGVFMKNLANLRPDGKGNYVLMDETGNPVRDKNGAVAYSIPATDAPVWHARVNAARQKNGLGYLGPMPDGSNPQSGVPGGSSQTNPIPVRDNLTARSLPNDTWIQLPDGSVSQIKRQPRQGQSTSASAADTSGTTYDENAAAADEVAQEDTES